MEAEVTSKTLVALKDDPNIVVVIPNQKAHLIAPKPVDHLIFQESKDNMTWGLKQLEIPKLWETTQGSGINVAV